MLRQRFSFLSVAAMICITVIALLGVFRTRGLVGFAEDEGFPFRWYWYTDFIPEGKLGYGYSWSGLVFDIIIWSLAIIAVGMCVEYIVQRFWRKHSLEKAT